MGYRVDFDKMNDILDVWSETNHIFAPAWDQRRKCVIVRSGTLIRLYWTVRQIFPEGSVLSGVTDDVLLYGYGSDRE
ncbi:MAG: hypothetical protein V8R46_10720 [Eubacterium ramulus]